MIEINSASDGPLSVAGIDEPTSSTGAEPPARESSRLVKVLKNLGWFFFGLFFLAIFTLIKLPEDRIRNYVQGTLSSLLAPKGVTLSAESGKVSVGWGLSYVMKNVTLGFPPPAPSTKIDEVSFSPSLLPMILGRQGGGLWIENGSGRLKGSFSTKGTQGSGSFDAREIDLGKLGVLPLAANIQGTALVTGKGEFEGDTAIPSTLTGSTDLSLSKIVIDAQSIMGFAVPKLSISEGKIELGAEKGKLLIKTFKIGKPGNTADDIQATASGDVMLGRNWEASTLNIKINFRLSESVLKAFVLIDALLGAGKQADGSYTYQLTGPATSPVPVPVK